MTVGTAGQGSTRPPHQFWMICCPYSNRGGQTMPTTLLLAPKIFRPSHGPVSRVVQGTQCTTAVSGGIYKQALGPASELLSVAGSYIAVTS